MGKSTSETQIGRFLERLRQTVAKNIELMGILVGSERIAAANERAKAAERLSDWSPEPGDPGTGGTGSHSKRMTRTPGR